MTTQHSGKTAEASLPSQTPASDSENELAQYVSSRRLEEQPRLPAKLPLESRVTEMLEKYPPLTPEEIAEREEKRREYHAKLERQSRESKLDALVGSAGSRYRTCSLETFTAGHPNQRKALDALLEFRANLAGHFSEGIGLVLYGPVGTGKDHLAFAICRAAILELGKSVEWLNGQAWFGELRDNISSDENEARVIQRLVRPDILVLSDPLPPKVGERVTLTTHQATMLYRLADARYSRGLPTIVTVNLKDDAEADLRMGAATWDRLCHGTWKIHCAWPSYRKPAREVK